MGGELFQDEWIEQGFLDIYQDFIKEIRWKVSLNKTITFNFVTNLVFHNAPMVELFLLANDLKISVSYDMKGRFKSNEKMIFAQNVERFKDNIEMVSVVQTKQNIEALLKGDGYFNYLYQNFRIDFDSYLPSTKTAENMMPSETLLLEFYKHLVDHYPETITADPFVNGEQNKMSCTRGNSYTVLFDGSNPAGCSGSVLLRDSKTEELGTVKIIESFITDYDCLSCEFYKRCPFTCFIKNEYSKIERDLNKCVFKEVFYHVEDSIHKPTSR